MRKKITEKEIIKALRNVKDPEIGFDVVEIGLVNGIEIKDDNVKVKMTLTSPFCPFGGALLDEAKKEIEKIKGVKKVEVVYDWEHPWTPEKASKRIRKKFGI